MASIDGDTGERPDARDIVLRKGTAAAALMRRAARLARDESLPVSSLPAILRPRGTVAGEGGGWMSVFVRVSFLLVFVLPAALSTLYFTLIAAGLYSTEVRFAVRSGERSSLEQMASLGAVSSMSPLSAVQDTLVVTNFIKSRALVEQIDKELNLRQMFSRDGVDFLSAFDPDAPVEELVRFWQHHVKVGVEAGSGLVTVTVRAFTPEDALAIAKAITQHSENMANAMSSRASGDLLADTEAELARAEARLKETRGKLQALRNAEGTLDPNAAAKGLNEVLAVLRTQRAQAESQLETQSAGLSADAPQLRPLRAKVAALDAQIAQITDEMAGPEGSDDLSATMTKFDALELDNQVAERRYAAAVAALESARLSAERQRVYVNTFVEASLPQEPTGPPRFWYALAGIAGPFFAWAGMTGLVAFLRNRFA